ncbi:unnamed protein product, partial [Rotaria sp. Silwood1]
ENDTTTTAAIENSE